MGIFNYLTGFGGRDLGIDLGTANTLVYVRGTGIVLSSRRWSQSTKRPSEVQAVGAEAEADARHDAGDYYRLRPLKDGVIADFDVTEKMLATSSESARATSCSRARVWWLACPRALRSRDARGR